MILDNSTKEGVFQQLNYLSKRYEELLKLFDETENATRQQAAQKPSQTTFFKKRSKKNLKNVNNTHK